MKLTVLKRDGTSDVFGNIMGVSADAESYFLTISYAISNEKHNGVFSKIYQTGQWKNAVIDADASAEYSTPNNPIP